MARGLREKVMRIIFRVGMEFDGRINPVELLKYAVMIG